MVFLFCQPGLNNINTVDFLIKELIVKSLKLNTKNIISLNSFKNLKKQNQIKLKRINFFSAKLSMLINGFIFLLKLKKIISIYKISHLLFDSYSFFDFFFFTFLGNKKIKLIIYLRIPYDQIFGLKFLFWYSINRLKKFQNIEFITDTINLKKHFKKKYKIKCHVIPIPGKIIKNSSFKKFNLKNLKILFPGKSREEKGINILIELFSKIKTNNRITLKFQKNKKIINELKNKSNLKLSVLSNNLSYAMYIRSIRNSDIIILPYTHPTYKLRSSGVFIDAIKLNKIVIVTKKTWMSDILIKNNIKELYLQNWNFNDLIKNLININSKFYNFKNKYSKMRNRIIKENSDEKFYKVIKKIIL